jgi:hypothetical protein
LALGREKTNKNILEAGVFFLPPKKMLGDWGSFWDVAGTLIWDVFESSGSLGDWEPFYSL